MHFTQPALSRTAAVYFLKEKEGKLDLYSTGKKKKRKQDTCAFENCMSDAVHPCALDRLPREFRMYAHTSFSAPLPHCHVQDNSLLVAKKKKKSAELEKALHLAHHGRHLLKRGGKKVVNLFQV